MGATLVGVVGEPGAELVLGRGVEHVGRGGAAGAHAHVQRRSGPEGEAAPRFVVGHEVDDVSCADGIENDRIASNARGARMLS